MPTRIIIVTLLLTAVAYATASAAPIPNVGDTIELKATHHLGVPLHNRAEPTNDYQRVPDGALATVLEVQTNSNWRRVKIQADSREGWLIQKYILRIVEAPPPAGDEQEAQVWGSPQGCTAALAAGARMKRQRHLW